MRTTTASENASATAGDDPHANVLLLVTDDQGAWVLDAQMPELHTPAPSGWRAEVDGLGQGAPLV